MFWSSAIQVAAKLESLQAAESKLLALAHQFRGSNTPHHTYEIKVIDTVIPFSVLPVTSTTSTGSWSRKSKTQNNEEKEEEELVIHGVQVTNTSSSSSSDASKTTTKTPLVLLHGYMNASTYFYRNFVGLSEYYQSIYSLDLLGWGLSSRPDFKKLKDDSVETAEDFFVQSLEAWREKNQIDTMILAGHSMGGYLSVAYCERYPERVEKLILLSPVGVPEPDEHSEQQASRIRSTWRGRFFSGLWETAYSANTTPASILRSLPSSTAQGYARAYVDRRIPAIRDVQEQHAVADYLFYNNVLPGSGEYCINRILHANVLAKKPTLHRIPHLKVDSVTFLYGTNDWMNPMGGLAVQEACEEKRRTSTTTKSAPKVDVYAVRNAGHLLMLENWEEFNTGVILAGGGKVPKHATMPVRLLSKEHLEETTKMPTFSPSQQAKNKKAEIAVQ